MIPSNPSSLHGGRDPPQEDMKNSVFINKDGTAAITEVPFSVDPDGDTFVLTVLGLRIPGCPSEEIATQFAIELVRDAAIFLDNFQVPKSLKNLQLLLAVVQQLEL